MSSSGKPQSWAGYAYDCVNRILTLGIVPDVVLRSGIRWLLWDTRRMLTRFSCEEAMERKQAFVDELKTMPIAIQTQAANEQHYEVPAEFYQIVLGPHLKYSSALYNDDRAGGRQTLGEAEAAMLKLYCERAELRDGQDVLDVGCGWGSLSLFIAQAYPSSRVTGVSNSNTQREFIMAEAKRRRLDNLTIVTADLSGDAFDRHNAFDRLLSVECLEHMKNYQRLFERFSRWLRPDGKAFVHIFTSETQPYHFQGENWMAQHFFSGGSMPSADLFLYFNEHIRVTRQWRVDGRHYAKTCRAWLQRMDRAPRDVIMRIFKKTYGERAREFVHMWRAFFMSCEELFAYDNGSAWFVSHYLFENNKK